MIETHVTVTHKLRTIKAGVIYHDVDRFGNPLFIAERHASGDVFPFHTYGGALLWCQLDGILRGK